MVVADSTPTEIIPGLFVGSLHSAFNRGVLEGLAITHIINLSGLPATFPKHFTYLTVDLRDKDWSNLLSVIPAANIFIESGLERKGGAVLVHCAGGRSRSPSWLIATQLSTSTV